MVGAKSFPGHPCAALNVSGLFLRFDLTMQKKGGMTNDVKKGLVTALSVDIIGN